MKRVLESILKFEIKKNELIVFSNYFTSKIDPQRKISQPTNNFDYIKNWYQSIIKNNLKAVIFYDELENSFVEKHENSNVIFVKCILGNMSLNDERFFVFNEFISLFEIDCYVLFTDINDVIINKSPLESFINSPEKIFVGRDELYNWRSSSWSLHKVMEFQYLTDFKIPASFLYFPIFNAGLIGGSAKNVKELFQRMETYFLKFNDSGNYNMIILNWVIFSYYYKPILTKSLDLINFNLFWKLNISMLTGKLSFLKSFFNHFVDENNKGVVNSKKVYSGYPFNSLFKKHESPNNTSAYLIHK